MDIEKLIQDIKEVPGDPGCIKYAERSKIEGLVKDFIKGKVREFTEGRGVEAHIAMSLCVSFPYSRKEHLRGQLYSGYHMPTKVSLEYIAIWNSVGSLPGTNRWLNKIIACPKIRVSSVELEDGRHTVPSVKIATATDPLFTPELARDFGILSLEILKETNRALKELS